MADDPLGFDSDFDLFHDALAAVWTDRLDTREERRTLRRLERNGPLARLAARRVREKFLDDGGDPRDIQSILDWLVQNWPAILEMIKTLIALFSV